MLPLKSWLPIIAVLGIVPLASVGSMYPVLNDVSTDLDNPPAFKRKDLGPLNDKFKPQIQKYYPNVKPLLVKELAAQDVFATALETAKGMTRWRIVHEDPAAGQFEAVAVTLIMRFRDDLAIRISGPTEDGIVRVDMRSKSRLGKGDIGANAARITAYMGQLAQALKGRGGALRE